MKRAVLLVMLLVAGARADDSALQYADNAILNAAEHGARRVTLVFGDAPQAEIDLVADSLRRRGYVLDEEAALLNPRSIKILRLGSHEEPGDQRGLVLSVQVEP